MLLSLLQIYTRLINNFSRPFFFFSFSFSFSLFLFLFLFFFFFFFCFLRSIPPFYLLSILLHIWVLLVSLFRAVLLKVANYFNEKVSSTTAAAANAATAATTTIDTDSQNGEDYIRLEQEQVSFIYACCILDLF